MVRKKGLPEKGKAFFMRPKAVKARNKGKNVKAKQLRQSRQGKPQG